MDFLNDGELPQPKLVGKRIFLCMILAVHLEAGAWYARARYLVALFGVNSFLNEDEAC